jgi:hypothetical protein
MNLAQSGIQMPPKKVGGRGTLQILFFDPRCRKETFRRSNTLEHKQLLNVFPGQ